MLNHLKKLMQLIKCDLASLCGDQKAKSTDVGFVV